ncbi:MAG: aldo/keto reductase [Ruminococcus sp.]|jgi:predicted aldo/keto reductase-like oxidoreductase|nr:aldo/keto reductase [Ruminococcus sp.]
MSNIYSKYFPLALGTNRLPIKSANDTEGIEQSALIIKKALECGIRYIDTAYTYSAGGALQALAAAAKLTDLPFDHTVKCFYTGDYTADDARKRAEMQLEMIGKDYAEYFVCWNITSYEIFEALTAPGAVYDGALRLKADGVIGHICASLHVPIDDQIKIIKSGLFEAVTVSYNLLNASAMQCVLNSAAEENIGVAVMNPLAGGIIPNNPDIFGYAKLESDKDSNTGALRFVKAHPAVNLILSGVSSEAELLQNIETFTAENSVPDEIRLKTVLDIPSSVKNYCSGCNYCKGCPKDVQIIEIMQRRNRLNFKTEQFYNRTDKQLVQNINLFHYSNWKPEKPENPCIKCGICEKKCTQHLPIIDAVADMYKRAAESGYSTEGEQNRVKELIGGRDYAKIALYPNGGFANKFITIFTEVYPDKNPEWIQFNSNKAICSNSSGGMPVYHSTEISSQNPDIIIVCSYKYQDEIYADLLKFQDSGIEIVKLHRENDVPWVW